MGMARLTDEERAQHKALSDRLKAEEDADNAAVVEIKNDKGHTVILRGADAQRYRKRMGLDDDDEDEAGGDDDGQGDDEDAGGYFGSRKSRKKA